MKALQQIIVPEPLADAVYRYEFEERRFEFIGLKSLLGKADYSKAGDRNAGLCAADEVEREVARRLLSDLSLQHLYERPLLSDSACVDQVMQVNYDIDLEAFAKIKHLSLGELKDCLLRAPEAEIKSIGRALTGVMAAALAKICDIHELILIPSKIENSESARTHLGRRATLSSRLQPNHPTDDHQGISLLLYAGLALGSGDALLGINPANDNIDTIIGLYHLLDKIRRETQAPTQICVLSHIKTVLRCLDRGAPVEILFQSIAGTEATNLTEFDISVEVLDQAHDIIHQQSPLIREHPNARCMYFETGQGSELTYAKHNGIDMCTCEALCYGLARRYRPFMVNNVTGFIGPETHADNFEMMVSNLQDHFMGKLLGLPMGMAPCYTLHSGIGLEGQQIATQLLTAAGANFFMDVHLNTDRMLAYFDTSAHDDQTLRELYGRRPTAEFEQWAVEKKIFAREEGKLLRGERWGDPRIFVAEQELDELCANTSVVYDFNNAGPRPLNQTSRDLRLHQAYARNSIYRELDEEALRKQLNARVLCTRARDKAQYLNDPECGAFLDQQSAESLSHESVQVQIIVSDGLSANAVHANIDTLLKVLLDGFKALGISCGQTILVPRARVKLSEQIASKLNAQVVLCLIGERPGGTARASRSLSCYYLYHLLDESARAAASQFSGNADIRFEYSVLSNIYDQGLAAIEAGSVICQFVSHMLSYKAAGNRLESLRGDDG